MLKAVVLGPGCTRVTWRVCRKCMSSGLTPKGFKFNRSGAGPGPQVPPCLQNGCYSSKRQEVSCTVLGVSEHSGPCPEAGSKKSLLSTAFYEQGIHSQKPHQSLCLLARTVSRGPFLTTTGGGLEQSSLYSLGQRGTHTTP